MVFKALISISCFAAASWLHAQEPFDVSLAHSSVDLSPYYRAVIREATERYRGDGFPHMITRYTTRTYSSAAGIDIEEKTDTEAPTNDFYLRKISPTGEAIVV